MDIFETSTYPSLELIGLCIPIWDMILQKKEVKGHWGYFSNLFI